MFLWLKSHTRSGQPENLEGAIGFVSIFAKKLTPLPFHLPKEDLMVSLLSDAFKVSDQT